MTTILVLIARTATMAVVIPFLAAAWLLGEVCHALRPSEAEKKERWRAGF